MVQSYFGVGLTNTDSSELCTIIKKMMNTVISSERGAGLLSKFGNDIEVCGDLRRA